MPFWSTKKLKAELSRSKVVSTLSGDVVPETAVVNGAYELSLGPDTYLTSNNCKTKQSLGEGEQLVIPPGQFGLLLTEEKVSIPVNAIGLISIKASIKFRGLINVSGFHVDSGFSGRLKFAVYNAGSQDIVLERRQPVFLLWLCSVDEPNAPYAGVHANQESISPEDVMRIQGDIASPSQLKKDMQNLEVRLEKEIDKLENKIKNLVYVFSVAVTLLLGVFIRGWLSGVTSQSKPPEPMSLKDPGSLPTPEMGKTNEYKSEK